MLISNTRKSYHNCNSTKPWPNTQKSAPISHCPVETWQTADHWQEKWWSDVPMDFKWHKVPQEFTRALSLRAKTNMCWQRTFWNTSSTVSVLRARTERLGRSVLVPGPTGLCQSTLELTLCNTQICILFFYCIICCDAREIYHWEFHCDKWTETPKTQNTDLI